MEAPMTHFLGLVVCTAAYVLSLVLVAFGPASQQFAAVLAGIGFVLGGGAFAGRFTLDLLCTIIQNTPACQGIVRPTAARPRVAAR